VNRADLRRATACLLAAVAVVAAASAPPPEKGNAVYVAATLKGIRHHDRVSGAKTSYDMAACEKLVLTKANPKKGIWVAVDLMGNEVQLQGAWQPWMFRNKEDCRNGVAIHGEAPVSKSAEVFTVAPPPQGK
jgi:hypothetical protein